MLQTYIHAEMLGAWERVQIFSSSSPTFSGLDELFGDDTLCRSRCAQKNSFFDYLSSDEAVWGNAEQQRRISGLKGNGSVSVQLSDALFW